MNYVKSDCMPSYALRMRNTHSNDRPSDVVIFDGFRTIMEDDSFQITAETLNENIRWKTTALNSLLRR